MDADDARLEANVAMALAKLRAIDWPRTMGDANASGNSPDVLMPLAYAMFEHLAVDVAHPYPREWQSFLRAALNEVIYVKGPIG